MEKQMKQRRSEASRDRERGMSALGAKINRALSGESNKNRPGDRESFASTLVDQPSESLNSFFAQGGGGKRQRSGPGALSLPAGVLIAAIFSLSLALIIKRHLVISSISCTYAYRAVAGVPTNGRKPLVRVILLALGVGADSALAGLIRPRRSRKHPSSTLTPNSTISSGRIRATRQRPYRQPPHPTTKGKQATFFLACLSLIFAIAVLHRSWRGREFPHGVKLPARGHKHNQEAVEEQRGRIAFIWPGRIGEYHPYWWSS